MAHVPRRDPARECGGEESDPWTRHLVDIGLAYWTPARDGSSSASASLTVPPLEVWTTDKSPMSVTPPSCQSGELPQTSDIKVRMRVLDHPPPLPSVPFRMDILCTHNSAL